MMHLSLLEVIFILLLPLGALVFLAFVIWILVKTASRHRNVLSRERMTALERGMSLPPEAFLNVQRPQPRNSLKSGIVEIALGTGLGIAILICCPDSRLWGWGLVVIFVGLAHLIYWKIQGRREWEEAGAHEAELAKRWVGVDETSENIGVGKS